MFKNYKILLLLPLLGVLVNCTPYQKDPAHRRYNYNGIPPLRDGAGYEPQKAPPYSGKNKDLVVTNGTNNNGQQVINNQNGQNGNQGDVNDGRTKKVTMIPAPISTRPAPAFGKDEKKIATRPAPGYLDNKNIDDINIDGVKIIPPATKTPLVIRKAPAFVDHSAKNNEPKDRNVERNYDPEPM